MLHAASREALAVAEATLVRSVDKVQGDPLSKVGADLFAVVSLLARESGLRRTLADASTAPAGREKLIRDLLGRKVGKAGKDIIASAVSQRWSSPRELLDGLEILGRTVYLIRAERDSRLDAVEDELFRFARIVEAQPELDRLLSDPVGDPAGKLGLVRDLLGDRVEPVTKALIEQLVSQLRGLSVVTGLDALAGLAAKRRERSVAHVRTSVALTAGQQSRLAATLERVYSRPIALHVQLDPSLGGGLVIRIGDEVIDGSVAGRLETLRRELA